ncbi:hypothetical protein [Segatella hominis]|uniref:Uncharacterized protein n=2 Tax=Segatella hominis TaxID=2518605 RepID=A0A4Y8VQ23_9BACT|nr:hypothetical protein [Segatella hominis]TFH82423.1 hypothetical protein EXN75_06405 [Segatella hominis]
MRVLSHQGEFSQPNRLREVSYHAQCRLHAPKAKEYWNQMVELGKIDVVKKCDEESRAKAERLVNVKTVKHTDARDVGVKWICLQAKCFLRRILLVAGSNA